MRQLADRERAIETARRLLAARPVYLDTETTGLDRRAQVVDLCVLNHDGEVLVDTLVRPTLPIPRAATAVHGITNQMTVEAPTWREAWPQVRAAVSGRTVAIYNAEFDVQMMRQSHDAHRMPWSDSEVNAVCIMQLYARFHGAWSEHHRSYSYQKLEQAGRQLKIPLPNKHRAKDDALLAQAVLIAMARQT